MSVDVLERPATEAAGDQGGGVAARRAMLRWSWRLFRREWRQHLLIFLLVAAAVAAVVVGSAVAVNTPPPAGAGFGTAQYMASWPLSPPKATAHPTTLAEVEAHLALIERTAGPVQVIENQTVQVPGSNQTYQIRSQDPRGPYGGPMLRLLSGRYPASPDEVALTPGVASALHLGIGDPWAPAGGSNPKTVVGLVENPQSLLDDFALVVPGQVPDPTQVTALFDASPAAVGRLGSVVSNLASASSAANTNTVNPETIVLAVATVGMLLIALVSIGGFTVMAQRRMRSLGMLESLGATDRNVRLVLEANGAIVGLTGALVGAALGLVAWLLYRPTNEQEAHHLIAPFALPWAVIGASMVLAVIATTIAASYPARAITRIPVVAALAGRPAPPRRTRRSFVPGVIALAIGFGFFSISGGAGGGKGATWVIPGFVALVVGIILISPFLLVVLARVGRRAPVAVRLPLRDMARYRARSGSALSAISVGVLIAVVVCALATARYSNVFDFVGPNMAANQLNVYTPASGGGGPGSQAPGPESSLSSMEETVHAIAATLGGAAVVGLESPAAGLQSPQPTGRQWDGPIYVATPALLRAFGIDPSAIPAAVDVLSARPGLAGSGVQLVYNDDGKGGLGSCEPGSCLAHPVVEEESRLPKGTSAPNTVITESALRRLGLAGQSTLDGWELVAANPITPQQLSSAQGLAAADNMSVESKNDAPTSSEIVDWATVIGIALALGILAMSVGLIRSETAQDLRTLTAAGASSRTRRALTAVTAGGLAFGGALLGTLAAYVALTGFFRANGLEGGLSDLYGHIPWTNLFLLVVAMPLAAVVIGWVLAGREPPAIATRPIE
jgi:putative ABC transport system permease protein